MLGNPIILNLAEVEKRGRAERETLRKKNAVPTPVQILFYAGGRERV
jgi:hypothetical protein